jgi:hypothetical protein
MYEDGQHECDEEGDGDCASVRRESQGQQAVLVIPRHPGPQISLEMSLNRTWWSGDYGCVVVEDVDVVCCLS